MVRARVVSDEKALHKTYCRIEVEDDGPGMPEQVKKSLFTSATISTTPGGTGIGTRFVKNVADIHGGRVGVESELGQGARFWLDLPMERP
nr:ATP-binding protein [Chthonomonas calidirosea]